MDTSTSPQIIRLEVSSQDVICALEAEVGRLHELDTCCCGSPMNGHTWGDGHSPVSVYAYTLECEQRNREKAEAERDRYRKVLIPLLDRDCENGCACGECLVCCAHEALEVKP